MRSAARAAFWAYCVGGVVLVAARADMPQWYIVVFGFFALKIAFRYEKCTVSYLECKLRGVPKERGWIHAPLHEVVALRESAPGAAAVAALAALFGWHYFGVLGRGIAL